MQVLVQDLRYALRQLGQAPAFAVVAVLTLALAIGANITMFSIVRGVILKPLPYADAERLVRVYTANPEQRVREGGVSLVDFEDWRARATTLNEMAAYQGMSTFLTGRLNPLELQAVFVTEDFFAALSVPAELGRTLVPEDVRQAARAVVISNRLWRTEFGADPGIVGRAVRLGPEPYTVVGVASREFRFPTSDTDLWVPYSVLTELEVGARVRVQRVLQGVARLAEGASLEQAGAELNTIAAQLAAEYPESNGQWNAATVVPLPTTIVGDVNRALVVVSGVVGFMLLIGCANLANLLLARGALRSREVAIRAALGASAMRLARQFFTESLVLALLGCIAGVALSAWGIQIVLALSGDTLPRAEDISVDGVVLAFSIGLAVATALLFGLLPALRTAFASAANDMSGGRGIVRSRQRLSGALVVAETSLAVVLVVGAGLMARSFLELRSVDSGLAPDRVLAMTVLHNVSDVGRADIMSHLVRRRNEIIDRLAALPGVVDVGATNSLPLEAEIWEPWEVMRVDGGAASDEVMGADVSYVSPGYLRALGIRLLEGDGLPAEVDRESDVPLPVLLNEMAAVRLWPTQSAVGRVLRSTRGFEMRVVGVVGDVRHRALDTAPQPALYAPQAIAPRILTTFVIRSDTDALTLVNPVRAAMRELDPNQPIRSITPMSGVMSESLARDRLFTVLFGMFGGLALALAAVGVYGVVAHAVSERTQEIGVRIALGATAGAVLRMILGAGVRLVSIGVVIGAIAALLLCRVLESQLYGVSVRDPVAFIGAVGVLLAAALLACYVPANRAARVDPMQTLREQ